MTFFIRTRTEYQHENILNFLMSNSITHSRDAERKGFYSAFEVVGTERDYEKVKLMSDKGEFGRPSPEITYEDLALM